MKIDEILLKVMKLDHDKDYEMSVNEGTIEVKDTAQTTKVKDTAQKLVKQADYRAAKNCG